MCMYHKIHETGKNLLGWRRELGGIMYRLDTVDSSYVHYLPGMPIIT